MTIADKTSVNSIEGMKNTLPGLRRKLNTDPVYFKKVYMHTFDLAKAAGARTLAFDTGESHLLSPLTSMFLVF
jgi:DCN1-like protein 1/2